MKMRQGFKKRKGTNAPPTNIVPSSDAGSLQQVWTTSCMDLLRSVAAETSGLGGEGPAVVCLVESEFARHPLISQMTGFKLREVNNLEGKASFILPSKKVAFLVLDGSNSHAGPNVSKDDAELLRVMHQKSLFLFAKEKFASFAGSYGQGIVLVVGSNSMDLFKFISLESINAPSITVIYCGSLEHAIRHICHRACLPDLALRQAKYDQAVTAVFSQPIMHQHIAKSIPGMPNPPLTETDLLDLLSGRVSQDVCIEHFGWTKMQAATVLNAVQVNQVKEN